MKQFPLICFLFFGTSAFGAAPSQWTMEMATSCKRVFEQVSAGAFTETNPNETVKTSTFGPRVLNVTAQAMTEMDHLDKFVRDRDIVAEIGGFGVLKQTGSKQYTMTEFVAPHPEHILVIETLFQNQFQSRIPNIVLGSHSLVLEAEGNTIQIKSDKTELTTAVQASDWSSAHPILESLAKRSLPASEADMLAILKSTGPIRTLRCRPITARLINRGERLLG